MITRIKELVKKFSPVPLSKNHHYDRLTVKILKAYLRSDSNCIDVGCHRGEILDMILDFAPQGLHYGFEPIPPLHDFLKNKFSQQPNCKIRSEALSDKKSSTSFNYVVSNPAYSGLIKRSYDRKNEVDEVIQVETIPLDDVLPKDHKVDFIKIDVEGGEYQVLNGARRTISDHQPIVIFEHGIGASDHYGTTPSQVFEFFDSTGLKISTLQSYVKEDKPMSEAEFVHQYNSKANFYFIAHP